MKQNLCSGEGYALLSINRCVLYALLISVFIFFWPGSAVKAQSTNINDLNIPEGGLKIGDTIPESLWHLPLQVVNHPDGKDTITLNDYRGKKLIILDFWATTCKGCILSMPKILPLRRDFSKDFAFLPVTYEQADIIQKSIRSNPLLKGMDVPVPVGDCILEKIFPHKTIPHTIWIGKDGRLLGVTTPSHVTRINIGDLIAGKTIKWPYKVEVEELYHKPLLRLNDSENLGGFDNTLKGYSVITGYKRGINRYRSSMETDSLRGFCRLQFANHSIFDLYMKALDHFNTPIAGNHIIWKVDNDTIYRFDENETGLSKDVWYEKHGVCYEVLLPTDESDWKMVQRYLLGDLNKYLGLDGHMEIRRTNCLILKNTSGKTTPNLNAWVSDSVVFDSPPLVNPLKCISLKILAKSMNEYPNNPPIIDESNHNGNEDLKLKIPSLINISQIREILKSYGFDLIKEQRDVEFFVLSDHLEKP